MILAVDPGQSGAIAHLHDDGRHCCLHDIPVVDKRVNPTLVAELLRRLKSESTESCAAVVERVSAMPKQGVSSTFVFGTGYGVVLGVLATLRIPVLLVTPAEWKRAMRLSSSKEASRAQCLQLFPDAAEMLKRKKDEGRAEALLLGLWFSRRLQEQHNPESSGAA